MKFKGDVMDYEFIAERLVKLANVSDLYLARTLKANIISELVAAVNYGRNEERKKHPYSEDMGH